MENKKLIPLSDFVLEQKKRLEKSCWQSTVENSLELIFNYTEFIKQPLKLEMLVLCDDEGNILSQPKEESKQFVKAKENILFEGFGFNEIECYVNDNIKLIWVDEEFCEGLTVEDLTKYGLTLTPAALKKIGIKE